MTRTLLPKSRPSSGGRTGTTRTSTRISQGSSKDNWDCDDDCMAYAVRCYCWNIKITHPMLCIFIPALSNNSRNILSPLPLRSKTRIMSRWGKFCPGRSEAILFSNFLPFRMKSYLSRCLPAGLRANWTRGGRLWQPVLLKLWSWQRRSNPWSLGQERTELWGRWLRKAAFPDTKPWR